MHLPIIVEGIPPSSKGKNIPTISSIILPMRNKKGPIIDASKSLTFINNSHSIKYLNDQFV